MAIKAISLIKKGLTGLTIIACIVGYQYPLLFDVTKHHNSTLNEVHRALLKPLAQSITVEIFTPDRKVSDQIVKTLSLFEKETHFITHNVHSTALSSDQKNAYHLRSNHNLLLKFGNKIKAIDINLSQWNENLFANAIRQILRNEEQWVVFLSNHGEQSPSNADNRHLSVIGQTLKDQGLRLAHLNLMETSRVPDNTQLLVIADSQTDFLPEEVNKILDYLNKGGNLLWLVNSNSEGALEKLSNHLGIQWLTGTILDQKSYSLGTPDPSISVITHYPRHPITQSLDKLTIFPWARALEYEGAEKRGWTATPILVTNGSATLQVKPGHTPVNQQVKYEKEAHIGKPLTIGAAFSKAKQKVVVIGNSHFLSNAGIHNYGNQTLANNLFDWLSEMELSTTDTPKTNINPVFNHTFFTNNMMQYGFPYGLPLLYLIIAWRIQHSRRSNYTLCE